MPEPINAAEFQGSKLQENMHRASGGQRNPKDRIGGIFNPEKSKLRPGEMIFRIGNAAKSAPEDACGAWWMYESTLLANAEHAADIASFEGIIRQNLAVPPAFSPMNRLLRATVRQPLFVLAGVGAAVWRDQLPAANQAGMPRVWAAGAEMGRRTSRDVTLRYQLFVPRLDQYGTSALTLLPDLTISAWFSRLKSP